jgi:CubicO group peptidase (beta-lactamase class C family)
MSRIFPTSLVALFTIFLSCTTTSFEQNIEISSSATDFFGKIDSIVIHKMNHYNIPGLSIGLVRNDSILYTKGYGVRNIDKEDLVTENTIFHTASISKLFTASAIINLVNEEQLSLEDKLVHLIPALKYKDERIKNITIKDLLNHTSGLPDVQDYHWERKNQLDTSLKEYIASLELELESPPSTTYSYSNLGYNLLGYVIERNTKTSFELYVKDSILNPSGMVSSDFRFFKIADSLISSPHTKNRITGKVEQREVYPYTREHAASSTLNASAKELSMWMNYFMKEINSKKAGSYYDLALKPTSAKFPHIGLGFQQYDFDSKRAVGHYGGDKGFRSFLMMIPERNIGLVVLGNCDYEEDYRQEIILPIARLMLVE